MNQNFQARMAHLSDEIKKRNKERQEKYDENHKVREKIQKVISEYKEKEEAYRKKMESVNTEISKVQENLQEELKTGTIG